MDECHNSWSSKRCFVNYIQTQYLKLTATVHNEDVDEVLYFYSACKGIQNGFTQDYKIKVIVSDDK